MERFCRGLSIDVIHRSIFKNNRITLLPYFTFTPKTGVSFYRVPSKNQPWFQMSYTCLG